MPTYLLVMTMRYLSFGLLLFPIVATAQFSVATSFSNNIVLQSGKPIVYKNDTPEILIRNKQVLVKWKQKPAYIYYGWQPFSEGNLQNGEQLPASTFKLKVE